MQRRAYIAGRLEEPLLGTLGVGDGLLSREGLGCDDEEGRFRVASLGDLGDVSAVDVRDKVAREALLAVRLERLGDHDGAEVGPADTDVDDGVDRLAGVALPLAGADLVREGGHAVQDALDLVGAGLVDLELVADVAECDVEDGAVLRGVDVLAGEHLVASLLDASLLGELDQGRKDVVVDQVLGKVEQDVDVLVRRVVLARELFEPLRVRGEQVLQDELGVVGIVQLLELGPRGVVYRGTDRSAGRVSCSCKADIFVAIRISVIDLLRRPISASPARPAFRPGSCKFR